MQITAIQMQTAQTPRDRFIAHVARGILEMESHVLVSETPALMIPKTIRPH